MHARTHMYKYGMKYRNTESLFTGNTIAVLFSSYMFDSFPIAYVTVMIRKSFNIKLAYKKCNIQLFMLDTETAGLLELIPQHFWSS